MCVFVCVCVPKKQNLVNHKSVDSVSTQHSTFIEQPYTFIGMTILNHTKVYTHIYRILIYVRKKKGFKKLSMSRQIQHVSVWQLCFSDLLN